jgi:hypothetical protein
VIIYITNENIGQWSSLLDRNESTERKKNVEKYSKNGEMNHIIFVKKKFTKFIDTVSF